MDFVGMILVISFSSRLRPKKLFAESSGFRIGKKLPVFLTSGAFFMIFYR
jgi:hypothetical protein